MVCCALLSTLIAAALWFSRWFIPHANRADRDPLAWRLHDSSLIECPKPVPTAFSALSARMKSVGFAVEGLRFMLRNEPNARIHLAASIFVVLAGMVVGIKMSDWRWIAVAVSWVWFAEAVNTGIEHLCNVVCREQNKEVRIAKDVAAAAVLVSALGAAILGALTFLPYITSSVAGFGVDFVICRSGS